MATKNGWKKENGEWYYYQNGNKKTGWIKDKGKWYLLSYNGGAMLKDREYTTSDGKKYYFNTDGSMATGDEIDVVKSKLKLDATGDFKYQDSGLQRAYNAAKNNYDNLYNNPTANGLNAYKTGGMYEGVANVDDLFNQIMNQEEFSYDTQKDALFQMYKKQYNNQATTAMKNAMGVGTAMSGGYNSSAAQTAAQSTYLNYMDALNDKAAETYQNALEMYKNNQQNLTNRFNIVNDMNKAGNEAYYTQLNNANQRLGTAYNTWQNDRTFQYNQFSDNRNNLLNRMQNYQTQANWKKDYELRKKAYTG